MGLIVSRMFSIVMDALFGTNHKKQIVQPHSVPLNYNPISMKGRSSQKVSLLCLGQCPQHEDRLRVMGYGFKGELAIKLAQGVGQHFDPYGNRSACHQMMKNIMRRIGSRQLLACAQQASKEAEVLYASGQCTAAVFSLQLAIHLNNPSSIALSIWLQIHDRGGVAKDENSVTEFVRSAHLYGNYSDSDIKGVLAYCLLCGEGVEQDHEQSLLLAQNSSNDGSKYGQYTLCLFNYNRLGGLPLDLTKAAVYCLAAATQGLAEAQWQLGYMCNRGFGVPQDYTESYRWFQLAAAQGYLDALFWIALSHENGWCVAADIVEAIRWYKRAQAVGSTKATNRLRILQ